MKLTYREIEYLTEDRRLGRIATADATGRPHVTPVGMWRFNTELGTIDVTGRDFASTKKFRNVRVNPRAALLVDDLASVTPWRPRAVLVQGPAEALPGDDMNSAMIRITPEHVVSWGVAALTDPTNPTPAPPQEEPR